MTDSIKETLFNVLQPYLFEGFLFLDLFSGTGSLSLEAFSRGAESVHAVENHPGCIELIRKNIQKLAPEEKFTLHKKNVFSFLKQARQSPKKARFDIIVADPPFSLQAGDRIMESLQNNPLADKGTVVAIETNQKENLKNNYLNCYLFSKKEFSDKRMWFYEFQ